ncbi:MAG TPA: hypothetical protein VL652_17405 [Kutzneria sp.]|jgi:hypothetical protein|nr:hypothetical protein [Kutzneria sp.]
MRNAIRVLVGLVVLAVCSGSSLVTAPPLPRFTTGGAQGRPALPWSVVSSDDDRLMVAVHNGTPTGVEIFETPQAVTVVILGLPPTVFTTLMVRTTMAVVELPHPLDGRPLVVPDQGQGGW